MANKFFSSLAKKGMIIEWAPVLDWYLSSEQFKGEEWKKYVSVFTRKIKKINCIQNVNIKYGAEGSLSYPARRPSGVRIIIEQTTENCESVGKDLVRHIRNGIAHGRARFTKIGTDEYIEIKDFKDNMQLKQTAYILIPRECIIRFYEIYLEINQKVLSKK